MSTNITRDLDTVLLPQSTPIEITVEPGEVAAVDGVHPLARSTVLSWQTSERESENFNPAAGDTIGPFHLGVVVHACGIVDEEINTVIRVVGRSRGMHFGRGNAEAHDAGCLRRLRFCSEPLRAVFHQPRLLPEHGQLRG